MSNKQSKQLNLGSLVGVAVLLSACNGLSVEEAEPYVTEQKDRIREQSGTIHGNDKGFVLFSNKDGSDESTERQARSSANEGDARVVSGLAVGGQPLSLAGFP